MGEKINTTTALHVIKNYLTKNRCYKAAQTRKAVGIQVHTIGCAQGTAQAVADYWNQEALAACVTYVVDADTQGKALQLLPEETFSWADAGWGNRYCITIECCESDFMTYTSGASYKVTDNEKFLADIRRSYNGCVLLCADICTRYGWNPKGKLDNGMYVISDHNEGRLAGLSSDHVDTSHLWHKIGKSMFTLRDDVAKAMGEGTFAIGTERAIIYRVRKSWVDVETQFNAYENFEIAKANCPDGYSVFDTDGKCLYTKEKCALINRESEPDEIWMGWTIRETGSAGLRCIHGDNGKAYGLQFDYRYGLVPFMKYCRDYNPERYGIFGYYIQLGEGSPDLVYNEGLGKLWQELYDKYTEEFCQLQYTCAYQQYYLPAKNYILTHYGFDMDRRSPALKGSLWSMSFRSGQETGAKKFSGIRPEQSDEQIMLSAYSTYGNQDGGRWTSKGQLGDALEALAEWTYTKVKPVMDPVVQEQKKEEPKADKPAPKTVVVYHVQLGYFDQFDLAEKESEDLKKRGIDCSVEVKGTGYYIQGGAYNLKDNAKKAVKDLASRKVIKKKGIKPFYFSTKEKI